MSLSETVLFSLLLFLIPYSFAYFASPSLPSLADLVRTPETRRALVLVSKVLQLLGNGQSANQSKEKWMATAGPYLQRMMPPVSAFIDRLAVREDSQKEVVSMKQAHSEKKMMRRTGTYTGK